MIAPSSSQSCRRAPRSPIAATLLLTAGLWWGNATPSRATAHPTLVLTPATQLGPSERDPDRLQLRLAQANGSDDEKKKDTLSYDAFLTKIKSGEVKEVEIDPRTQIARVRLTGQEKDAPPLRVKLFDRDTDIHQHLIELLREKGVEFGESRSADGTLALQVAINALVVLVLLGALILLVRRSAKATNQAMSFGKARARFQMEAQTNTTFGDVAGIDSAKEELQEVVAFLKETERFSALGARIPKGVLLYGQPGTGKTLLARAVAGEAGVPFFSISGSEFVEMFVGVGASRVRDLFRRAKENAPCLIFIDEIDAVGRQRGVGIGGGNDEREQTLNQLLTELDGFEDNAGVIVIAATNRPDVLDRALLRPGRFDRQIVVDLPDFKDRLGILEVHVRTKKLDDSVDVAEIARQTPGFSGAELANLLNEAAILTARRQKPTITMDEIGDAIERVVAGMERTPLTESKNKRLIAYYEIGHALIATLLPHHDLVRKVTLIPRGRSLGATWYTPDEASSMLVTRAQIEARIATALGGRAVEEEIFGTDEVTSHAGEDIQRLTQRAREMVTVYGMSELGSLSLNERRDVWGRAEPEYSDAVASQIDRTVREIVGRCHDTARSIIREHRALVDRLVDLLLVEETIEGDRFREIVAQHTDIPPKATATTESVTTAAATTNTPPDPAPVT